jgi:hypothetical protein
MHTLDRHRHLRTAATTFVMLALLFAGSTMVLGCSSGHTRSMPSTAATAATSGATAATSGATAATKQANGGMDGMDMSPDAQVAWAARPAYVSGTSPRTEEAYAFALARPDVVQWMPCYCGCVAMHHRSNLDCFVKPDPNGRIVFEEHASYCDVCVNIALLARQRLGEGRSLSEIRAEVDRTLTTGAPGTPTELPPA